ncbi:MAG: elongation factor G [Gammaproteobacteria bacterium]|nr:MAG: elongation factor G [Gammaproteobacteria bacterium]
MTASGRLHATEQVRNIALVGHAGAGKTTLLEQLLARSGAIHSAGSVDKGNTISDYSEQEKRLGHSLETAVCHLEHDGIFMNLLDTPGYPDFIGRAISVLPGVETAAVVINAQAGVELVSRRIMRFAAEQRMCRMVIVNRIDAPDVDFAAVMADIRETFGKECLPLNLPAEGGRSVADCFFQHEDKQTDFSSVQEAHTEIVDQVVELDEELMELYLEQGEDLSPEQLHDPFERALRRGHLIPVCFVSAETGAGLNQLLNIFTRLMPSPLEANPPQFFKGEGEHAQPVEISGKPDDHFLGHVFKVNVDPYIGKIGVFRVHQGTIRTGDQIFVGERRKGFKAAHLYRLQGSETTEIPEGIPGDICAVAKVDELHFDAVLHASHDEDQFHLKSVSLPEPMHGVALSLTRRGDEKKLSEALHKLVAEDPSLRLEFNAQANETVLRGMGELHLRLVLERMREEFNLEVETHPPQVAYRETISRKAEGHHRHKKQTGGAGQFGEVFLRVEPLPRDSGFEFVNEVVGGAIPSQFIPAVEKGVRQVLEEGAVAGFPLQDVRVIVYDGKHHPVDSKEVAFVAAGRKAFLDAVSKAKPQVLEPIAHVEVTVSGDYVGDITGHLAGIRGRIEGNTTLPGNRVRISAQVPVAELDDFQTTLKSLTGGAGSFTMSFDHYDRVPPDIQKRLEAEFSAGQGQ